MSAIERKKIERIVLSFGSSLGHVSARVRIPLWNVTSTCLLRAILRSNQNAPTRKDRSGGGWARTQSIQPGRPNPVQSRFWDMDRVEDEPDNTPHS